MKCFSFCYTQQHDEKEYPFCFYDYLAGPDLMQTRDRNRMEGNIICNPPCDVPAWATRLQVPAKV